MRLGFREKVVLGLGALLVAMILAYTLIVTPYMKKMELLDRRIDQKTKELKQIATLSQEYIEIKERMEQFKGKARKRGKNFPLFSHLESLAAKTLIRATSPL